MRPTDVTTERLWNIAEPVCAGAGYELVDLMLTQSRSGWVLRVFIDYPSPGSGQPGDARHSSPLTADEPRIGFNDCERVSRELGAVLDVEDPITQAYSLEVSSPGLDRPLRKVAHFQRFLGQVARVSLREGGQGRRNFKGTLVAVSPGAGGAGGGSALASDEPDPSAEVLITIDVDGTEYRLPFSDIENAQLVPDWDALFQRGQPR